MPLRPFTLAARLMHYSRYGSGAQDQRLTPLYLGYPSLLLGKRLLAERLRGRVCRP